MPIEFPCSGCGQALRVPDDSGGRQARCPKCSAIVPIPRPASPPLDASPERGGTGPWPQPDQPAASLEPAAPPIPPFSASSENPYQTPHASSFEAASHWQVASRLEPTRVEVADILRYAWETWKANLTILVVAFLIVGAINYAISFTFGITQAIADKNNNSELAIIVAIFGNLINFLIQLFLSIGQKQIHLKVARRLPVELGELFQGGPRFLPILGATLLFALAVVGGAVLCVVPALIVAVLWWPFSYLIIDGKAGITESFAQAYSLARVNVGTTVLLALLSLALSLLGLAACCVGLIFTGSLVTLLWAVAYLMMSGQISVPRDLTVSRSVPPL